MEAKLKFSLKPIPWFLLLRAFLFATSWLVLPAWVFVAVGAYLYFVPFFQASRLRSSFMILLVLGVLTPKTFSVGDGEAPNILGLLFLFVIFFLILGIKDLILVRRKAAFQFLSLLLLFLLSVNFFAHVPSLDAWQAFLGICLFVFAVFLLVGGAMRYEEEKGILGGSGTIPWLLAFFLAQVALVVLFLPLVFSERGILFFLAASLTIIFSLDAVAGRFNGKRILIHAAVFSIFALVLLSQPFGA